jgi:hypothetical protein
MIEHDSNVVRIRGNDLAAGVRHEVV